MVKQLLLSVLFLGLPLVGSSFELPDTTLLPGPQTEFISAKAYQHWESNLYLFDKEAIPDLLPQIYHVLEQCIHSGLEEETYRCIGVLGTAFFHLGDTTRGVAYYRLALNQSRLKSLHKAEQLNLVLWAYESYRLKQWRRAENLFQQLHATQADKGLRLPKNIVNLQALASRMRPGYRSGIIQWSLLLFIFGGLFFVIISLGVSFWKFRFPVLRDYALGLACGMAYLFFLFRMGFALFGLNAWLEGYFSLTFSFLALVFYHRMSSAFLAYRIWSHRLQRINAWLLVLGLTAVVFVGLQIFVFRGPSTDWYNAIRLIELLVLLNILVTTLLGWDSTRKAYRQFLRGQVAFVAFLLLFLASPLVFNLFEIPFISENSIKLAFLSQGIFFSAALSGWVTELEDLRRDAEWRVKEKQVSEDLLLGILPAGVVKELSETGKATPQVHENTAVLFTDFEGFTTQSSRMEPREVVEVLDDFFLAYDRVMERHGITRIKTIGDAYMAAAGVPEAVDHPSRRTLHAAVELLRETERVNLKWARRLQHGLPVKVGLHVGQVAAGIVGQTHFHYDIWGETVNRTARLQQAAGGYTLVISEEFFQQLTPQDQKIFQAPLELQLKGFDQPQKAYTYTHTLGNLPNIG